MQQRQLRLGDILDDYCPRERRVTNHAVVAMVGPDVKQTRCTTCDAEHEFKHAKVPRQRRKADSPAALYSQVLANGPKRVSHEGASANGGDHATGHENDSIEAPDDASAGQGDESDDSVTGTAAELGGRPRAAQGASTNPDGESIEPGEGAATELGEDEAIEPAEDDGPVHRPLIRASLPRPEGQPPQSRPLPEFTIRQPGGRQNRFRPRHQRGGQQFQQGNRSNGSMAGGPPRGGIRQSGGRPPQGTMPSRLARRHGPGRKRSK